MKTSNRCQCGVADLHPAYFAMVMATGIISTAAYLLDLALIARVLYFANIIFFATLCVLTIIRLIINPRGIAGDLVNHGRSVGFFTIVAGICILGTQVLLIGESERVAGWLWLFGMGVWVVLTYTIFAAVTIRKDKPTLAEGINGGWLLSVVAAQAVSVLGAQLSAGFGIYRPPALFLCLTIWLGGGMLYVWIISLIFYRYTFFPLNPDDLSPPYWINMGAVAISTLAGTMLISNSTASPLLTALLPFIKGATLLFWATATLWIPMLLILGIWRHVYNHMPIRYDPLFWGAVFPLGMYTACTIRVSRSIEGTDFLAALPHWFFFLALAAWLATFGGFVHRRLTSLSQCYLSRRSALGPVNAEQS